LSNIKQRLENALAEIEIIREALKGMNKRFPPCCLKSEGEGYLSCALAGPLPKEVFLNDCEKCISTIQVYLHHIAQAEVELRG